MLCNHIALHVHGIGNVFVHEYGQLPHSKRALYTPSFLYTFVTQPLCWSEDGSAYKQALDVLYAYRFGIIGVKRSVHVDLRDLS